MRERVLGIGGLEYDLKCVIIYGIYEMDYNLKKHTVRCEQTEKQL